MKTRVVFFDHGFHGLSRIRLGLCFFNHGYDFATYFAEATKVKKATTDKMHGVHRVGRGKIFDHG